MTRISAFCSFYSHFCCVSYPHFICILPFILFIFSKFSFICILIFIFITFIRLLKEPRGFVVSDEISAKRYFKIPHFGSEGTILFLFLFYFHCYLSLSFLFFLFINFCFFIYYCYVFFYYYFLLVFCCLIFIFNVILSQEFVLITLSTCHYPIGPGPTFSPSFCRGNFVICRYQRYFYYLSTVHVSEKGD